MSLTTLHEPTLLNVFHSHYTLFIISLFFATLVEPNKQFLNLKLLVGFLGQASKS